MDASAPESVSQSADSPQASPVVSLVPVVCSLPGDLKGGANHGGRDVPPPVRHRLVRLTTDSLEIWTVGSGSVDDPADKIGGGGSGSNGAEVLEVRHHLLPRVQAALGGRRTCLVDLVVAGTYAGGVPTERQVSPQGYLDLLVLAADVDSLDASGRDLGQDGGRYSVHLVRVSAGEAFLGGSVGIKVSLCLLATS